MGIMVTPGGGFDFSFCPPLFGDPRECRGDVAFPPSLGPQPSLIFRDLASSTRESADVNMKHRHVKELFN